MNKARYIIASIDYFYNLVKEAAITPAQLTAADDKQVPPEGLIDTKGNIRVPVKETPWTKEQFLPFVKEYVNKKFNIPDDAVLTLMSKVFLSQFALETGHGKSCHNYNVGNLATGENATANPPYWNNKKFYVINAGEVEHNVYVKKRERFRAYNSFEEGVGDYLSLIERMQNKGKGFNNLIEYAKKGDVEAFARGLKQAGYYTDYVEKYTADLKGTMKNIDKPTTVPVPIKHKEPPAPSLAAAASSDIKNK